MKPIVAAAMKLCCPELKGETLLAIEKRISPSPLIPALDPTEGSRAAGENCEVCDDGTKTVFDSLFIVEHAEKPIRVNIEAQATEPKGFPERQDFYVGRAISSEKSHGVFKNSEYHKLQKVRSIWLMFDAPKRMGGRIKRRYCVEDMCEEPNGEYSILAADPQSSLHCISTVYLPDGDITATDADPLNILAVMMRNKDSLSEKEQFLRNNGIVVDNDMKGAFETMCTLETHLLNKGRREGQQEAINAVAKKMLAHGATLEFARSCTGLTLKKLRELAEAVTPHPAAKTASASA